MGKLKGLLVGTGVALLMTLALPGAGNAKTQPKGKQLDGIYNTRYCEIFTVFAPEPGSFLVDVFNTVGLNDCPPEQWNAVDFNAIRESEGALLSLPNGPRRWVIDAISGATAGDPVVLSGLTVRKVATLETTTLGPPPFTELKVNRTTEWNYRKGRSIRQVISPEGVRYAMQAYTRTLDPTLTEKDLNSIDENPMMALPEGWRFKTQKIKRSLVLKSSGQARIVRDGLGCVYQRFKWPKPKSRR